MSDIVREELSYRNAINLSIILSHKINFFLLSIFRKVIGKYHEMLLKMNDENAVL